jgi:hypothetical protein
MFFIMTEMAGDAGVPAARRCRWCRIVLPSRIGRGRPREFCSPRCRQWDWVARQRADELRLAEGELVVARQALDDLQDRLFVLACAVQDVERDLAALRRPTLADLRESIDWLLEAARPLTAGPALPAAHGHRL